MLDQQFIKKILLEQSYITKEDGEAGSALEKSGKGSFTDYLLQNNVIDRSTLGYAIAEHYGAGFSDLNARGLAEEDINKIPETVAKQHRVVFVKERKNEVTIATDVLDNKGSTEALRSLFPGKTIVLSFAFKDDIDAILNRYQKELNTRFSDIIKKEKRVAPEIFEEIIQDA